MQPRARYGSYRLPHDVPGGHQRLDRNYRLLLMRRYRRRKVGQPDEGWRRSFALVLCALCLGTFVALGGQALTATAVPAMLDGRELLATQTVGMPAAGPLDVGLPQTAAILARDGSLLAEVNDVRFGRRQWVPLSAISQYLVDATMAAEDRRFFEHQGVDWVGLVRALGQNAGSDGVASGASTLEMQLVRNLFMPDERTDQTLSRKAREAVAALRLNERYRKAELFETYLNSVYYANQSYGAEAAAQRYFGKPARDLTLPEAALLAGIPQNPSAHNPLGSFSLSKARQEHILDLMGQNGFITPQQAAAAKAARLDFQQPRSLPIRAPHWVNYVRELVRERFGPELLFTGGLRIHTTLDPQLQQLAERIVFENEAVRQAAHANNSSAVVIDVPTGQVLAMVGSKNFFDDSIDGQVNVTVAHRQPGSSIKPLVYLAGFEKGLNPATEVLDTPTPFSAPPGQPPYLPENYEKKYYGRISLRDALGNSLNVPAVKVLKYAGVPHFQDLLRRLGITTLEAWDPRWLSLTLGGGEVRQLELTGAYATIARGGRHKPVEPLVGVETARGDVLYWVQPEATGEQAVDPRHAYQLLYVMGDPQARLLTFGPNTPLNINRPHMLKTGTTDDYRDTWTVGCLPQVCVGVWMGNTDNRAMQKTSSSLTAGKLWIDLVQAVAEHYRYPAVPFPVPDGVVVGPAPSVGGGRTTRTHEEVLLPGQRPRTTLEMNWMAP